MTFSSIPCNIPYMSAISDFLIKSAGMEKEANKVFQKLLKRGLTPIDLTIIRPLSQRATGLNRGSAAFRDLTTPLKDRKSLSYRAGQRPARISDLIRGYTSYLDRVVQNSKDPRIVDYLKYKRKLADLDRFAPRSPMRLHEALNAALVETRVGEVPALLKKYKVKTPYATTHHLADFEASQQANARALETPNNVTYIENPNPDQGYKDWRNTHFRVNHPGQRWTEDEMKQMLTSNNLGGTPLYETVFKKGTKEFPAAIDAYVADTPEVRKALDIPDSVKSIPIADVQDPLVDFVYKGTTANSTGKLAEGLRNGLHDALRNTAPEQYRKDSVLDAVLSHLMGDTGAPQHATRGSSGRRWFAPAAKTSAGYMGAADKNLIRLDADTLAKYRKLVADAPNMVRTTVRDAVGELSESQLSDLIRSTLRENRINKLRKAYANRIEATGLPKSVRDILLYANGA